MVGVAVVFGAGFSTYYPAFSAAVLQRVGAAQRGAAFGAMFAAFDIGIGSGSIALGWAVQHLGYTAAFVGSALLALGAWPYFHLGERRFAAARPGGDRRGTAGGGAGSALPEPF